MRFFAATSHGLVETDFLRLLAATPQAYRERVNS
jgi:hypothetical protein